MNDLDDVLETLRPRMHRARRQLMTRVAAAAVLPLVVTGVLVARSDDPSRIETNAPLSTSTTVEPTTSLAPVTSHEPTTTLTRPASSSTAATPPVTMPPTTVTAPPPPRPPATVSTTTAAAPSTTTARTPTVGAPLCPTHDPKAWHSLWDSARGCYYDHEHKDDPHELDALFGDPRATLGADLGLPWAAAGDRADGRASGWLVRRVQACTNAFGTGCVTSVRVHYHALFSGPGALERYRSAFVEVRGCLVAQPARCGTARLGGTVDFGALWFDDVLIPLPDQPRERSGVARNHFSNGFATWFGRNPLFDLALTTSRSWGPIDRASPQSLRLACTPVDQQCTRDASRVGLHILAFNVPASLDTDGDGLVTWSGWYSPAGQPSAVCQAIGPQCVPVSYVDMPVGTYQYRDDSHGYGDGGRADYDIAPAGASWIAYPN